MKHVTRPPRWALAASFAVVLIVLALVSQSYQGRLSLRDDQVAGCLRTTLDRAVNARGWRTAQTARQAAALTGGPNARTDLRAAYQYAAVAASLESRTSMTARGRQAFCSRAYPQTSFVPWKG